MMWVAHNWPSLPSTNLTYDKNSSIGIQTNLHINFQLGLTSVTVAFRSSLDGCWYLAMQRSIGWSVKGWQINLTVNKLSSWPTSSLVATNTFIASRMCTLKLLTPKTNTKSVCRSWKVGSSVHVYHLQSHMQRTVDSLYSKFPWPRFLALASDCHGYTTYQFV